MKKIGLLSVMLLVLSYTPLTADEDGHNHEASVEAAPHGGTLRDIGNYKTELVLKGDVAQVYLYDKTLKSITPTEEKITGQLRFPKQKAKKVTFKKAGEFYEGKLVGISKVHRYDLHVDLKIDGKKVVADFGIDNVN